jgi:phosphoserine phosphatase RsbU/P
VGGSIPLGRQSANLHQVCEEVIVERLHPSGPPIPPDVLPFVFQRLARGRANRASHGIGFGLFIARAIVSPHGGHIQVSSSTDGGTTFTVDLPKAL